MRYLLAILVMSIALLGIASVVRSQTHDRYYSETGHTLDPRFASFYDSHGNVNILGYPITDAFVDHVTGLVVQYFQNARLELGIDLENEKESVRFSPLGELLGGWDPANVKERVESDPKPGCKFFPQSWLTVCHSFLEFYESNGGDVVFGYPISDVHMENGLLSQYFQRFRFDWQPEAPDGQELQLAPLGKLHFDQMRYNPELLLSQTPNRSSVLPPNELQLETSVASPMVQNGETQHLFLTVRNQDLNPIVGAAILLTANFPTGSQIFLMPVTDDKGVSKAELIIVDQTSGDEIALEFKVRYAEIHAETRDSFIIR